MTRKELNKLNELIDEAVERKVRFQKIAMHWCSSQDARLRYCDACTRLDTLREVLGALRSV